MRTRTRFWTAAGSEAPRLLGTHDPGWHLNAHSPLESAVAATLCRRTPKHQLLYELYNRTPEEIARVEGAG
jgi:hypothetical protein